MKYIITTLLIFCLFSCEPQPVVYKTEQEAVKDKYSFEYITVDGCEYLVGDQHYRAYLAKVDCNCVPKKN